LVTNAKRCVSMIPNNLSRRENRDWGLGIVDWKTKKEISLCFHNAQIKNNYPIPLLIFSLIFFILQLTSCARRIVADNAISIAVSIPPQQWFVSRIAGDNVRVTTLAGPGANPHNFEPTPGQIQNLSSANAWILSGAEFEISLLPKVKKLFPDLLIVDGTQGVRFRTLEEHDHDHLHEYNINGDTSAPRSPLTTPYLDRHTWLGREPAKILASHIKDTLTVMDGDNEELYNSRYEDVIKLIDNEFDFLSAALAPLKGKSVFVYHPSFGYFLDEFDIHQEAVETGGKEPGPRQLNNLMKKIIEEQAVAVFVQAQFPVNAARTLAASAGVQLISLDPLAPDWLENIGRMGQALMKAMP